MNGKILKRRKNAFVLQPRDAMILKRVFYWRFLTGKQVRSLSNFNSQKRANDRLRALFNAGYLSRRLFINAFQKELLYFTGPSAIELIAAEIGTDPLEVRRKRAKALKTSDSFLSHFLAINDFRFSLEMAKRSDSRIEIDAWKYKPPLFLNEELKIFPDAYVLVKQEGKLCHYFLEIDRSVESRKRIKKKIETYLDYGLDGGFERQYGSKYFRLLIVAKTPARLTTLSKIIGRVTDKSFCWLTTGKNITPEKILSPIWHRPNKEGAFSLI